jgi:hypothetical protein
MKADSIRAGHMIGKRTVVKASTGMSSFKVAKSVYSARARIVTLDDGRTVAYELGTDVDVKGWAEPLPAGGVASGNVKTPNKVRASDGRWAGESVHGPLSTREHDLLAKTNMYDVGRVLGKVGASRDGVGSVRDTGPSFPPQRGDGE